MRYNSANSFACSCRLRNLSDQLFLLSWSILGKDNWTRKSTKCDVVWKLFEKNSVCGKIKWGTVCWWGLSFINSNFCPSPLILVSFFDVLLVLQKSHWKRPCYLVSINVSLRATYICRGLEWHQSLEQWHKVNDWLLYLLHFHMWCVISDYCKYLGKRLLIMHPTLRNFSYLSKNLFVCV